MGGGGRNCARFSGVLLAYTVFIFTQLIFHVQVDFMHMYSHLCRTKHIRKASNLLDTQKVDSDDSSLMCGPLP